MVFRNREGVRIDPVPFLVTTLAFALVLLSWGPGYLLAFGVPLPTAIGSCVGALAPVTAAAYYRLVWTCRPDRQKLVSPSDRVRYLAYLTLGCALLLVLLAIPLYARWR